jgi:type I restriction-modification system DNA methylase subunit
LEPEEQLLSASLASFKETVEKLIRRFESDRSFCLSKDYSEAQARVDFITPFFEALGWDVENEAGLPHHQREVVVERGENEAAGRPDYNFRLGGQTKFYVEAKAPSAGLDNPHHILQAKGYAWNTRSVFFVILTDFEEFRFYDSSRQPDERNPDDGLLLKLGCGEYLENAEKLWDFSRERVAAGSLDALLPKIRRAPHLRKQVDEVFLDEMTGWREELAKDIHKQNPALTAKQLNEVVQRLLDRIVFIRIAEDRHVIEKRQLAEVVEEWETHGGKFPIFDWLNALFHKINEDFNGEIFKPHLSEEIQVDSEILARIIKRLYPPKSPYRFDVIGVELLGSIYERYLGNTIRLTPKQVRVEEKPELRKAGGVYYTPKYIVDYIVKDTVGKIIEGKSPRQIEKIRILDPACGSGSFLIGALDCLIDYHIRWYLEHPKDARAHPMFPDLIKAENGEPRLSVTRKGRILRSNIYGLDIDPQAVEITMMSLYLKSLEGEKSLLPPKHSLLPELKYNIMCGNSLIGHDDHGQGMLFEDENGERINAFDWRAGFPEIMRSGGFDAVIGNPPYIRVQTLQEWAPFEAEYYKERYKAAASGNYDIYVCFVERGLEVLKRRGKLGFILPHKFFSAKYGEGLRSLIAGGEYLSKVVHFGDQQVFEGATNYTCLLFLDKSGNKRFEYESVNDLNGWRANGVSAKGKIPATKVTASEWNFMVGGGRALLERLGKIPQKLGDVADLFVGLQTDADDVFILEQIRRKGKRVKCASKATGRDHWFEDDHLKPFLKGSLNIRRYALTGVTKRLIFPYETIGGKSVLIGPNEYRRRFPLTWDYLEQNRPRLAARNRGRMGREWYGYVYKKNHTRFGTPKLLVPSIATGASFAADLDGVFYFVGSGAGGGGGYGVDLLPGVDFSPLYLLGLLNSRLLDAYLKMVSTPFRGGYLALNRQYIERLPIRPIDFSDPADKARHDKMVALVDRMLQMNKRKHSGKLAPSELDRLEREIASTDREIDDLVYELYAITDEERKIVEGGRAAE